MELSTELQNLGLSEKEAKVYLANLELGQSSVQNIAKKSGVNRATTYIILGSLAKKGLCSTFEQEKKTYYIATNPESLEGMFELQKKELDNRQKHFASLLPELKLVDNSGANKPVVKFFEGKRGLTNCYNEFVESYQQSDQDSAAFMFYNKDKVNELFSHDERTKYRQFRVKHEVPVKSIYASDTVTMPNADNAVRVKVSPEEFPVNCDIGIHGNSVRILLLDKLSGILINDRDVAESFSSLFRLAWEAVEARQAKNIKS
jgi:sugar-specific transcriptional regulator TrmB